MIRLVAGSWVGGGAVALATRLVQVTSALEMIVLTGASVAALGVLHAKVVRPSVAFAKRAGDGIDILLEMPDWRERIEQRIARIEAKQERLAA